MKHLLVLLIIMVTTPAVSNELYSDISHMQKLHGGFVSGLKIYYKDIDFFRENTDWAITTSDEHSMPSVDEFTKFMKNNPKAYAGGYFVGQPRSTKPKLVLLTLHVPKENYTSDYDDICSSATDVWFTDDGGLATCYWGPESP